MANTINGPGDVERFRECASFSRAPDDVAAPQTVCDTSEISSGRSSVPMTGLQGIAAAERHNARRAIIDGMLDADFSGKKREKIYERLDRYPEGALKLMSDYGVRIQGTPLGIFSTDSGMYYPGSKRIRLARGANVDYFIEHPRVSSFLESKKPLAMMAGLGAVLTSALLFTGIGGALLAAGAATFALAPFSYFIANMVRERSVKDPLVHETAHALDSALGAMEKYKDLPPRVPFPYKTKEIPLSVKSPEIIDCYLACKEGKARFVTDYAGRDPVEYFAESVRAFLNTDSPGENVTRADLLQKDPKMCGIIERLLRDISQTPR